MSVQTAGLMVALFVVGFGVGGYVRMMIQHARAHERKRKPLEPGDRVRFLVAFPELGIEAGEHGRIYLKYPGDDLEYWVAPDRNTSQRVKFFENELWQIERI